MKYSHFLARASFTCSSSSAGGPRSSVVALHGSRQTACGTNAVLSSRSAFDRVNNTTQHSAMWSLRGCPGGSCICFGSRMPRQCCRAHHLLLAGGAWCAREAACQAPQLLVRRAAQQPCRHRRRHHSRRTHAAAAAGGGKEATLQEVAAIDQLIDLLLVRWGLCQATVFVATVDAAKLQIPN